MDAIAEMNHTPDSLRLKESEALKPQRFKQDSSLRKLRKWQMN